MCDAVLPMTTGTYCVFSFCCALKFADFFFILFLSVPVICMKPQGIKSLFQQFPPVLTAVLRRSNTSGLPHSMFPKHTHFPLLLCGTSVSLGWCFCVSDTAPGSARAAFLEYLLSTPGNSCSINQHRACLCYTGGWLSHQGLIKQEGDDEPWGWWEIFQLLMEVAATWKCPKVQVQLSWEKYTKFVSQVIISFSNLCVLNIIHLDFLLRNRKFTLRNNDFTSQKPQCLSGFLLIKAL